MQCCCIIHLQKSKMREREKMERLTNAAFFVAGVFALSVYANATCYKLETDRYDIICGVDGNV
jgi:hypothetical protein